MKRLAVCIIISGFFISCNLKNINLIPYISTLFAQWPEDGPSYLSYSEPNAKYTIYVPISKNIPTVTGSVSSYSISPDLPIGLVLNSSTGEISGTPQVANEETAYKITASNDGGNITTYINITIYDSGSITSTNSENPEEISISYSGTPFSLYSGNTYTLTPSISGVITSCTSSPTLPIGLSIDNSTCEIIGTPNTASGSTSYTITATNSAGTTTSTTISIEIFELPVFTMRASSLTWNYVALSETGEYQIAVYNDGIYFSDDYGVNWTSKVYYNGTYDIRGAAISANGQHSLTSAYGQPSYRSNDYGVTWTTLSGICGVQNFCAMSIDAQYQLLVDLPAQCSTSTKLSTNYGASWTTVYSIGYSLEGHRGAAIAGTGQYQITTNGGQKYIYSDNYGAAGSWVPHNIPSTSVGIFTASMSDTGQYILLNGFGGVLLSTSGASDPNNFSEIMSDSGIWYCGAVSSTGQRMVAAKKGGNIFISYDYGATWVTVDSIGIKDWNAISISRDGTHITVAENPGYIYTAVISP